MMAEIVNNGEPSTVNNICISIKRQRLVRAEENVHPPPQRSVARVLFGIPDPVKTKELFLKMCEARETEFRERWNFDPVEGVPCPVQVPESSPTTFSRISIMEEEKIEAEALTGCMWTPVVPNAQPELFNPISSLLSVTTENSAAANPIFVSKDTSIPHKKRVHGDSICVLKQKSIKDYMKVKKPLRETGIVREKKPVP